MRNFGSLMDEIAEALSISPVLRDVLVLGLSQEVPAPNISPEKGRWWWLSQAGGLDELWTRNALRPGLVSIVRNEALRDGESSTEK